MKIDPKDMKTTEQVCDLLGTTRRRLNYLTETGQLPPPTYFGANRVWSPLEVEIVRAANFLRGGKWQRKNQIDVCTKKDNET